MVCVYACPLASAARWARSRYVFAASNSPSSARVKASQPLEVTNEMPACGPSAWPHALSSASTFCFRTNSARR